MLRFRVLPDGRASAPTPQHIIGTLPSSQRSGMHRSQSSIIQPAPEIGKCNPLQKPRSHFPKQPQSQLPRLSPLLRSRARLSRCWPSESEPPRIF